jgi:hypothetical protein
MNRIRMPVEGTVSTTRAIAVYSVWPNLNRSSTMALAASFTAALTEMKHPVSLTLRISPRKS